MARNTDDNFGGADKVYYPSRITYNITPNDDNDLPILPKSIYVGTGGHLAVQAIDGNEVTVFKNVPNYGWVDVRAIRVLATGTTATDIIAIA